MSTRVADLVRVDPDPISDIKRSSPDMTGYDQEIPDPHPTKQH